MDQFFILRLHLRPSSGISLSEAAERVLLILTGRTLRLLPYETASIRGATSGHVLDADATTQSVEIALPTYLCRPNEGLAHLMTLICSAAEYSYCDEFWVDDVTFPKPYVQAFKGPRFGIDGIRDLFGSVGRDRPLIGIMLKPRRHVALDSILHYVEQALVGGCDFVADDLLLVNPDSDYSLERRLPAVIKMVRRVIDTTKRFKGYFVNVSTSPLRAIEASKLVIERGATGLIINAFTMGFGAAHEVIDALSGSLPVITCNMGGGILTRPQLANASGKPTGISETVVSKLSRLAGTDAVHAGTSASECYGNEAWGPATRALQQHFFDLKPCFAVAEGDLNIANLWDNIKSLGTDVLLEPTSGILSAPGGAKHAATVFLELAERLNSDMTDTDAAKTIRDYVNRNASAGRMLDHFGYKSDAL